MNLNEIKLIIFDLDGTLYEDTDHFDYYASLMKKKLPLERQNAFEEEYDRMKKGEHLIHFGKAYDASRDVILTLDPMTLEVTEVYDWNGQAWTMEQIRLIYDEELAFDFENMIAIGDGWWLPYVAARHLGLSPEAAGECYLATKEYMVTEQFQLTKTPGLVEWLKALKEDKSVILMTNSEREDVNRLLSELGLTGLFTAELTSAFKPANSIRHLERISQEYQVERHQVLSIGDNFINEIAPALKMGMKGLYISSHHLPIEHEAVAIIPSLTAVIPQK